MSIDNSNRSRDCQLLISSHMHVYRQLEMHKPLTCCSYRYKCQPYLENCWSPAVECPTVDASCPSSPSSAVPGPAPSILNAHEPSQWRLVIVVVVMEP
jgi:hypothetical protein